jgi:hypothetical protein
MASKPKTTKPTPDETGAEAEPAIKSAAETKKPDATPDADAKDTKSEKASAKPTPDEDAEAATVDPAMLETLRLKPADGHQARDPESGELLPKEGATVENSPYWQRQLRRGVVTLVASD